MERNSLNRPPRSKRPTEVIRHVDETMDAYRRIGEVARKDKPVTGSRRPRETGDR